MYLPAFQVFERLARPRPVLKRLLDLVRAGGLLLVNTDMETDEGSGNLADWWYVMPPMRCSFYRVRTFAVALERTPHDLVGRRRSVH